MGVPPFGDNAGRPASGQPFRRGAPHRGGSTAAGPGYRVPGPDVLSGSAMSTSETSTGPAAGGAPGDAAGDAAGVSPGVSPGGAPGVSPGGAIDLDALLAAGRLGELAAALDD